MKITCPACEGKGGFWEYYDRYGGDCSQCSSNGYLGFKEWLHYRILMFLDWWLL